MVTDNPSQNVPLALCSQKHEALSEKIGMLTAESNTIKTALIGKDMRGGLVKDIQDIKSQLKSSWSSREKVVVFVAIINGIVATVIAFLK